MSVFLSPVGGAGAQFFDNNGNPLTGGKLYTYAAGTTTPQATYTSAAGATFHTNPIILDAAGRVPGSSEIWLADSQIYKFVLKDSNDVLLATWDQITGVNSNFVNYTTETEVQTATAGQTVFTLTTMSYAPGTGSLTVFVDGVNQYEGTSYLETNSTTVTFTAGLHVGALVKFTTAVQTTGNATDASVVSYTPAGTGAVTISVQDKLRAISVTPEDFGAIGDGVADDTAAFALAATHAISSGQRLDAVNTYRITSQLNLRYVYDLNVEGTIVVDFVGVGVIIGGNSTGIAAKPMYLHSVGAGPNGSTANPLVRVLGLSNGEVKIDVCPYVQIYADNQSASQTVSYSKFYLNYVGKLELFGDATTAGTEFPWINENTFYRGRLSNIIVGSTGTGNSYNSNVFYEPTMEGGARISFGGEAHDNKVVNVRYEGAGNELVFYAGTFMNSVTQNYTNSGAASLIEAIDATVSDYGYGNQYYRQTFEGRYKVNLFSLTALTPNYGGNTGIKGAGSIYPGLSKLEIGTYSQIWESPKIPVINGSAFSITGDGVGRWFKFYFYDQNGTLITGSDPGGYSVPGGSTWQTSYAERIGTIISGAQFIVSDTTTIKFVKIWVGSASPSNPFTYLKVDYFPLLPYREETGEVFSRPVQNTIALAASPTTGFAPVGQIVSKTDGASIFICTKSLDLVTTEAVSVGETAIDISDASGVASGDIVGLLYDNGQTLWSTVSGAPVGNTVTIADAPVYVAASGARIVFNKWVTK